MADRMDTPFTNEHFAAYCLKMLGQPYWYGCCGYKATSSLLARKTKQYPSHYGSSRKTRYQQDIAANKVVCDCIGGAKAYAWTGGGQAVLDAIGKDGTLKNKYGSNSCPDKGANSMFSYAKQTGMDWGVISTLPDIVGIALHKQGHVGYYVGNGYAVEWRGFAYGCVKTKVIDRGWTHWYKLPFINYGAVSDGQPDVVPDTETIRNLSYKSGKTMLRGEDVRLLQVELNALGFLCGTADGIFGKKTDSAVRAFQAANNEWREAAGRLATEIPQESNRVTTAQYATRPKLEVDGIVGPKTRDALQFMAQQAGAASMEAQSEPNEHAQGQTEIGKEQVSDVITPTIRIKMTREENIAFYGADEVSLDMEAYLRGVVPSEMYESANIEALKAQAICARTYAYYRRNSVLSDTANHQAFRAAKIGKCPRSDEAIAATRGMVLTYDGNLVNCFYCASNKGETKRSGDVWSTHYPYYVNKPDEWDEAARAEANVTSFGHGVGMSQRGAMWATMHGVKCVSILGFYYEGCKIDENYGA